MPIERGLQLVLEDVTLLEEMAFNLFESRSALNPVAAHAAWGVLSDSDRQTYRDEVLDAFREEVKETPLPPTDPGGGGPSLPVAPEVTVQAA